MSDEEVARALEREILGRHVSFSCGCVLEAWAHYPGKDWIRTGFVRDFCAEHPKTFLNTSIMNPIHDTVLLNGEPGPLEEKWLKADGGAVTVEELERAMQWWVARAAFEATSLGEAIHINELYDPWILSAKGSRIIDKHGAIRMVEDWVARRHEPGSLVNPVRSGRESAKMIGFAQTDYIDLISPRSKNQAAKMMLELENGPVLQDLVSKLKLTKKNISFASVPLPPLTFSLIKGRDKKGDPPYDTPPLAISSAPSWEELAGVGIDMADEELRVVEGREKKRGG